MRILKMEKREESGSKAVVFSLIAELEKGISIIRGLSRDQFAVGREGHSSAGAHIRHNLEFVNALLNGIVVRRVDYEARQRDARIENDPDHAIAQMLLACRRLESLTIDLLASLVLVRSEIDEDVWHASSVSREIEFLHSHTIHHYAIVARLIDSNVPADLGVAPSTVRYRERASAVAC